MEPEPSFRTDLYVAPPPTTRAGLDHPHEQVLAEAGFDYVGRFEFMVEVAWTVESLAGFSYSTSFLNREVLGDRTGEFERDLADRLSSHQPDGVFREQAGFVYQLARRPKQA